MKTNKLTKKSTKIAIISVASVFLSVLLVLSGIGVYFLFKKDNPKLEITTYAEPLITQHRNIDDLKVTYVYKDSLEVNNLWQSNELLAPFLVWYLKKSIYNVIFYLWTHDFGEQFISLWIEPLSAAL